MTRRILIIQGHPDASEVHFGHQLADSYATGARSAGHEVRVVDVGRLDFPLLRSQREWEHGQLPASLADAQAAIAYGFVDQVLSTDKPEKPAKTGT